MKFQRRQFIFGVPLFIILYIVLALLAMKCEKPGLIIIYASILLLIILLIANGIQRRIKKKSKKKEDYINFGFFIVLTATALIFTFSIYAALDNFEHIKNSEKTYATIYDVVEKIEYVTEYDEDGNPYEEEKTECDIYIKYEANGKEYKSKLNLKTCMKKEGQKVKIYYDKDNPGNYETNNILFCILGMIISAFAFFACLYNSYKELFISSKKKK